MKNNIELVEKIKTGDKRLEDFLKNNLLKSLEGININDKEMLIDKVFKEGLETYNSKVAVPFKFYLSNLLRKEINSTQNCLFSLEEQKIINLYLTKIDNRYLSNTEISMNLNINLNKVNETIDKFNNIILNKDNNLNIENIFPYCFQKINHRKEYFNTNNIITFQQIKLIGYYIGKVTGSSLTIDELKDIYKKDTSTILKELTTAFNLLRNNNNLKTFFKNYPNTEKELVLKANEMNIQLFNIKIKHSGNDFVLSSNEEKVLNELYKTKDENLSDEEMACRLNFSLTHYRGERTKLFNKLRKNKKLQQLIYKKYPGLNILGNDTKLSEEQIKLVKSIKEFEETPENYEKIIEDGGYQNLHTFIIEINNFYSFLRKNTNLMKDVISIYKDFDLDKRNLTSLEAEMLEIIIEADKQNISLEDAAKQLNYYDEQKDYNNMQKNIIHNIKKNRKLASQISRIYKDLMSSADEILNSREKKMLSLLNEHKDNPLEDKEVAELLEYKTTESYGVAKAKLINKIKANPKLLTKVREIYPEFDVNDVYNLPNNEKIILEILNNDYYITKTDEEIAKELGYNKKVYLKAKQVLINKIKNNKELLKNIKKKYPSFSLEQKCRVTFKVVDKLTDKEKRILQLLNDYKNKHITNKQAAIILGYKNDSTYYAAKRILLRKLETNMSLLEEAKTIYPEVTEQLKVNPINNLVIVKEEITVLRKNYKLNKDKNNLLKQALKSLEIDFYECLEDYTFEDKVLLALILRYYKGIKFSYEAISSILNINQEYIENLINSFLDATKTEDKEKKLKKIIKS